MKFKTLVFLCILVVTAAVFLVSCNGEKNKTVQSGILIENIDISPLSDDVKKEAEDCIFNLIRGYYDKVSPTDITAATINKIQTESKKIRAVTELYPLDEKKYKAFISCINNNSDTLTEAFSKGISDITELKRLYRDITAVTDKNFVAVTLYNLLLYRYDYLYEEAMSRYQAYPAYEFLLADAERYASEKKTLREEVGQQGFTEATKLFFFFSELFYGNAHEKETLNTFTNEELLILINNIDFSLDNVTENGYKLLISYIPASPNGDYMSKLLYASKTNGDSSEIATKINGFLTLFRLIRDNLSSEDCIYIKESDTKGLMISALKKFDDNGWELFKKVTDVKLNNARYSQIASEQFGDSYVNFVSTTQIFTLDQLKEVCNNNGDTLIALKGYIAGICPAIAYPINYD